MDNAPYHPQRKEKIPTSNSRKDEMIDWLKSKDISFPEDGFKIELYKLIKENKDKHIVYEIDEITKGHGHSILRLPYHYIFNPIELIWAQVKKYIATYNFEQRVNGIIQVFKEGDNKITPQNWKDAIEHCRKEEANYWRNNNLIDNYIDPIIINFGIDSSGEESDVD